jgi:hypothetical protein
MFSTLYVDGVTDLVDDGAPETVSLEFTVTSTYQCGVCGADLVETVNGVESEAEEPCYGDEHAPERVALSWCNSAAISVDEADDSVTVAISVGDPRGAFTFTVRRISDDVPGELAGRLVMHVPYSAQPAPHMTLTELHDGTYLVGVQ